MLRLLLTAHLKEFTLALVAYAQVRLLALSDDIESGDIGLFFVKSPFFIFVSIDYYDSF